MSSILKLKPSKSLFNSLSYYDEYAASYDELVAYIKSLTDIELQESECSGIYLMKIIKSTIKIDDVLCNYYAGKVKKNEVSSYSKIPIRFYHDVSYGGTCCQILKIILVNKKILNIRNYEYSERYHSIYEELMQKIRTHLINENYYIIPNIFISPIIDHDTTTELKQIIHAKNATIATSEAVATHIIIPDKNTSDDAEIYIKPVKVLNKHVRVHYWFYPDSYDSWTSTNTFLNTDTILPEPTNLETPFIDQVITPKLKEKESRTSRSKHSLSPVTAIEVTPRWLYDCKRFNEWMNEEDYFIEDNTVDENAMEVSTELKVKVSKRKSTLINEGISSFQNIDIPSLDEATIKNINVFRINLKSYDIIEWRIDKSSKNKPKSRPTPSKVATIIHAPVVPQVNSIHKDKKPKIQAAPVAPQLPAGNIITIKKTPFGGCKITVKDVRDVKSFPKVGSLPVAMDQVKNISNLEHDDTLDNFPYASMINTKIRTDDATFPIIVPSYANWFTMDSIHENEIKALPEYFDSFEMADDESAAKFNEVYINDRNMIVNLFRSDPRRYLTATSCVEKLPSKPTIVIRLHAFLESWGIINYSVNTSQMPPSSAINSNWIFNHNIYKGVFPSDEKIINPPLHSTEILNSLVSNVSSSAYRRSVYSTPHIISFEGESSTQQFNSNTSMHNAFLAPALQSAIKRSCKYCGLNLDMLYYVHKRDAQFNLCDKCFASGNFPSNFCSADFVRFGPSLTETYKKDGQENEEMEDIPLLSSGGAIMNPTNWSTQDTMSLLEALEMHGEDWVRVASHVGKPIEACILQFIQLPIDDAYVEQSQALLTQDRPFDKAAPFTNHINPIMSMVAFLSSHVSPSVGSAAASCVVKDLDSAAGSESDGLLSAEKASELVARAINYSTLAARELAVEEERKLMQSIVQLTKLQMKKIELKMKIYEDLENTFTAEREKVEACRKQILQERLNCQASPSPTVQLN